ncbi:MAG: CPBP family intramembrane glutamic endopeptidase [Gammaproteobacteria bacterium]|nr:CPBP family intramembrane glutamic endopeptidase [Gammaproteobacteria bacterium]
MNPGTKGLAAANGQDASPRVFLLDLVIYISIMFLVRELYFSELHFIANGLLWSLSTLLVACLLMRFRKVFWKDLGLRMPSSFKQSVMATVFIFAFAIGSIIVFQVLKDQLGLDVAPDASGEEAVSKFGDLSGNWAMFFMIIPFVWLQSMLEELLDRGFLINWIERALSSTWVATIIAVLLQAMIFGFRHSQDLSERSITVGLIGLAMGIGYVAFGRNLWPLVFAHCLLNTLSMAERV